MAALRLYIGSYGKAGGEGLYAVDIEPSRAILREAYADAPDASWAVHASRTSLTYAVEERADGFIGVHRLEGGRWRKLAAFGSGGAEPCHLVLDPSERRLAVANYGSGSIALFELSEDGLPSGPPFVRTNTGSGPVADRQEGPHAHCVVFEPRSGDLHHVDLGTDQIMRHPKGADGTLRAPTVAFQAPPGSGPRHLLFLSDRSTALLVSELASTLTVLDVAGDRLQTRERLSTAPLGYEGENLGGHLEVNAAGDRIYVSNRGHDSIAVFALDDRGRCTCLQHIGSRGASPRFFKLLEPEHMLVVVNEDGGNMVLFHLLDDGRLEHANQGVEIPGPAFVYAWDEDLRERRNV